MNRAWSNARLNRSVASRSSADAGQQPVEFGVGLGQLGERAQRIGAAAALRVRHRLHGRIPGRAEFRCVRDVALRELPGGLVDAGLDVGDRRRQTGHGAVDVGGGAVDGVEQGAGLTQRGLRGTDGIDQPALPIGRPRDQRAPVGDVLVGERQPLLGGVDVAGHRRQCRVGELRVQPGHGLLRRFETRGQIHHLLSQRVEPGRGVDEEIAQLPERLALGLQFPVGPRRRDDHPGQQVAPLLRGLGHGVVEDLANVERLGERRLGVGHRRGERCGVLLAEFLYRKRQFVVAGAYRVVDVDDDRAGQVVERVDGDRRQRVGVGGIHPLRGGELGLAALALAAPPPQQQRQHRDAR